jgi:hypothetical protein
MLNETHTSVTQDMRECIQECNSCHDTCTESVTYCLQMGGEHANPNHIRLLLDCANICETSANFMLRGSDLHPRTCEVCAEVCERCADSCEQFEDDEMMQHCAQVCRSCADSCYEMAGVS